MPERQLSDRELRILRGMIDDYEQRRLIDSWFTKRWRATAALVGVAAAASVVVAAILQLVHGR